MVRILTGGIMNTKFKKLSFSSANQINSEHEIKSNQILACAETDRVVAVFYHDYDLDNLLQQIEELTARVEGYEKRVCSTCDGHGMVGNIIESDDCPDCKKVIGNIEADAIEKAVFETRDSMQVGSPKWFCRVTDLEQYANKLRTSDG